MTKPLKILKIIDNKVVSKRLRGLSLFSSAGIAETYYKDINIDMVVANELVERRAKLYQKLYPETKMINGDITQEETNLKIKKELKRHKIDILIATPP